MVYYLHETENMENVGDLVCRNWTQLCLQISLMMRLQKLYFHCFHILNLLASWNWFWMPFICHWRKSKAKRWYTTFCSLIFLLPNYCYWVKDIQCVPHWRQKARFIFFLIDGSLTEYSPCNPPLQYPGGSSKGVEGMGTGILFRSGLRAEARRAVKLRAV